MENVVAFNNELSGLYDSKPPISKAKMAAITKSAMRAIKFYKHVVQSVEKFILKCKPEYKVPGLYVIDSIVRQSRHQYGPEKDVFAPRFARNIKETFANLFRCAHEDKSRIIRVLNLWQKNNVFAPEVIQPIFDLADPNHPIYQMQLTSAVNSSAGLGDLSASANGLNASVGSMDMSMGGSGAGIVHGGQAVNEDKLIGIPDLSSLSHEKAQNVLDNSTLKQLEHMQQYLKRQTATTNSATVAAISSSSMKSARDAHAAMHSIIGSAGGGGAYCSSIESAGAGGSSGVSMSGKNHSSENYCKYSKSSHDFGYDEDDIGDNSSSVHASNLLDNNNLKQLLNDPNVLRQLQTLQNFQKFKQQEDKQHKFNEMRMQEEAFEKHLQNVLKASAPGGIISTEPNKEVEFVSEEQKIEVINLDANDSRSPSLERDRYKRRRSRSRSRERSGNDGIRGNSRDRDRRHRSRTRSRSRSPRSKRRRSSRDRGDRGSERSNREKDKEKDREHERERRRKGLPDVKKEHLSVCSTTLWVGHLSKLVYQEELSDTFGEYGDIVSIDQIVPRGCAFIVMNRRQDAHKAMQALKNHKLQGRAITISWAAGKGVKSKEWKDFWDLELGVTYIPWSKLDHSTDFDSLEEGGMFDEDSMPQWVKEKIIHMKSMKEKGNATPTPSVAPPPPGLLFGIDTTQPPPGPPVQPGGPTGGPPPPLVGMVGSNQFPIPPHMAAPPPRPMLGPISVPISGIPMPPNMVPGMPPPHPMMLPSMMPPPGFPPIAMGQVDKNRVGGGGVAPDGVPPLGPPPMGSFVPMGHHHMGLPPPGPVQFPPPPNAPPTTAPSSDDQMDIEMDDDDGSVHNPPANYNLPPYLFQGGGGGAPKGIEGCERPPDFSRDRRGGPGNSRWGGSVAEDVEPEGALTSRWHENGGGGKFGGPPNFGEGRGGRGGPQMNMPPMEMVAPPRPDFMDDFDNRGPLRGPRGAGGNPNGDFFPPNMQNRFSQPSSLLQMRIPPPNAFNARMSGPPMFMRGQVGGVIGGRQQGPGFFNDRPPFDRDGRGGRGGGAGRGGFGGGRGGRGGGLPNNWRDDNDDDSGGMFQRRMMGGPGGGGGNRFRDRDSGLDDRYRDRGGGVGRRGGPRDREWRDNDRGGRLGGANRYQQRDDRSFDNMLTPAADNRIYEQNPNAEDTEDDWDRELEEFDAKQSNAVKPHNPFASKPDEKPQDANIFSEKENREEDATSQQIGAVSADDEKKSESRESVQEPIAQNTAMNDLVVAEPKKFEMETAMPPSTFETPTHGLVNPLLPSVAEGPAMPATAAPAPSNESSDLAKE